MVESALVLCLGALQAALLLSAGWLAEGAAIAVCCMVLAVLSAVRPPVHSPGLSYRLDATEGWALGGASPLLVLAAMSLAHIERGESATLPLMRALLWSAASCAALPIVHLLCTGSPAPGRVAEYAVGALPFVIGTLLGLGAVPAAIVGMSLLCWTATVWLALRAARCSFTLGEACTVGSAVALLSADTMLLSACELGGWSAGGGPSHGHGLCIVRSQETLATEGVLMSGLMLAAAAAAATLPPARWSATIRCWRCYGVTAALAGGAILPWLGTLLGRNPIAWAAAFIFQADRLRIATGWVAAVVTVAAAASALAPPANSDRPPGGASPGTRKARLLLTRKLYHFLALAMFVPTLPTQLPFVQLAFAAAVALFTLLEALRIGAVPPLARPLERFLAQFVDGRDSGTLILTHLYLLLGCAAPILLEAALPPPGAAAVAAAGGGGAAAAAVAESGSHAHLARRVAPYAGLAVLGVGDAFASIVGVYCGRHRWPGTGKTIEGSVAGAASMLVLLLVIESLSGRAAAPLWEWAAVGACTALACILEAFTSQIDNLFLPLAYYAALLTAAAAARA